MKRTVGDIELELWAKETRKACRNFIQLCTGEGVKIYGEPFNNKFHTRLHFCRRDLIAMANAGEDDNGSQFLFTLSYTPDLRNKDTILDRVTGESIYTMLKLEEALVDGNDRPLYPPRLIKTIILKNPFFDIIPRIIVQEEFSPDSIVLCNGEFCYRDFNLFSFGGEAKEDEKESVILNKMFTGKGKSAHDHLTDPKLSSQPAVEPSGLANKKRKEGCSSDWESDDEKSTQGELEVVKKQKEAMKEMIKNTLRDAEREPKKVQNYRIDDVEDDKDIKKNE
ncbi:Peptidyl-prolyl cis-trans isomerase CWC27 like protein [Eufriesea mexicana]|nr:Peptidyl-prolyl cis-trans isomerase CWC27 like protein [Eufriesea mexicana]